MCTQPLPKLSSGTAHMRWSHISKIHAWNIAPYFSLITSNTGCFLNYDIIFLLPFCDFPWPNCEFFHCLSASAFLQSVLAWIFHSDWTSEINRRARRLGRSLGDQPLQPSALFGDCEVYLHQAQYSSGFDGELTPRRQVTLIPSWTSQSIQWYFYAHLWSHGEPQVVTDNLRTCIV